MIIGYARVSTEDQHLDAQISALKAAGAERLWSEKVSGSKKARPELDRLLDQLRPGDVVVVTKFDRLSRSLQDLLTIVETVRAKGVRLARLCICIKLDISMQIHQNGGVHPRKPPCPTRPD